MTKKTKPTTELYANLQKAFDQLNVGLFQGELPQVIITLQRKKNVLGYFCHNRFGDAKGEKLDEIALNPQYTNFRDPMETLSTLAHEMVHLWQQHFGTPTPSNHHNAEWGRKMNEIGLPPRPVRPGGKITGNKVSHSIDPNGAFAAIAPTVLSACDSLQGIGDIAPEGPKPVRKSGSYKKYECPCCNSVARAKTGMTISCEFNGHELKKMYEEGSDEYISLQVMKLAKARKELK